MLSVILPSYNGSELLKEELPPFLAFLKKEVPSFEVIVVDDGSETWKETQQAAEQNGCRFERNPSNEGKGAAVKRGVKAAKGDQIIFTDVDIPFLYKDLLEVYNSLQQEEKSITIGDRTLATSQYYDGISSKRRLGSKVFTGIISGMFTKGLKDTQCGLKGFTKSSADAIFDRAVIKGFAFDVELLVIAHEQKITINRVPVVLRNTGGSSVSMLKHGLVMLRDLFRIKINTWRKKYR